MLISTKKLNTSSAKKYFALLNYTFKEKGYETDLSTSLKDFEAIRKSILKKAAKEHRGKVHFISLNIELC